MALLVTKIFIFFATLSYVIPFLISFKLRKRLILINKPIFIYVILDVLFVILEYIFIVIFTNSHPVHHISSFVLLFLSLTYFYSVYLNRYLFVFCLFIMLILFFYETVYLNTIMEPNYLFLTFSNCLISIISFFHLFKLFNSDNDEIRLFQFQYFISMGFFIFNSSSFFMSLFESQIVNDLNNYFVIVSPIFSSLIVFQNLMISKGIWILKRI